MEPLKEIISAAHSALEQKNHDEALNYYRQALALCDSELGADTQDYAQICFDTGSVLFNLEQYEESFEWHIKALAIFEKLLPKGHNKTATVSKRIYDICSQQKKNKTPVEWFMAAVTKSETILGTEHPVTATLCTHTADILRDVQKKRSEAIDWYLRALAVREKISGTESVDAATLYNAIGVCFYRIGKYEDAMEWYKKAAVIREKVSGSHHVVTATVFKNIADTYAKLGKQAESQDWYLKTMFIYSNKVDDNFEKNNHEKILEYCKKLDELREKIAAPVNHEIICIYANIAETLVRIEKYKESLDWYEKIFEIESLEQEAFINSDKLFSNEWARTAKKYYSYHKRYSGIKKKITESSEKKIENILKWTDKKHQEDAPSHHIVLSPVEDHALESGIVKSGVFFRKARGANISRQIQRVYVCFDPAGNKSVYELIDDVLSRDAGIDCVVSWAAPGAAAAEDELRAELKETQALIVWVTLELLESVRTKGLPAEFLLAKELNVPILPVAVDEGLLPEFTASVGKLHGIARNDAEYRAKLHAQLENFLASEDLMKKIDEKAFTAEVFLSYRKIDIDEAHEFMKDLHNIEGLQGVSVWYDHFLTAGREFDNEIRESIEKSDAFVLLVTPHITEKNAAGEINYVAREEAPFAVEKAKPILPVEVKPRDIAEFAVLFPNVGEPVSKAAINEAFKAKLGEAAYIKTLGDERAYSLGMAYLRGYHVEKDYERAVKLLETAANGKSGSAFLASEQLARIYEDGLGGVNSLHFDKALHWRQRAVEISRQVYGKKHPTTAAAYNNIGKVHFNVSNYKEALHYYNKSFRINEKNFGLEHISIASNFINIGEVYNKLLKPLGPTVLDDALKILQKTYGEDHPLVAATYVNIGLTMIESKFYKPLHEGVVDLVDVVGGELDANEDYSLINLNKALNIYKNIYGDYHICTATTYIYIGRAYMALKKFILSLEYFDKGIVILEKLYGMAHPLFVTVYTHIAIALSRMDRGEEALSFIEQAFAVQNKFISDYGNKIASLYWEIGELYLRLGKEAEALVYFVKDVESIKERYGEYDENKEDSDLNYIKKNIFLVNRTIKLVDHKIVHNIADKLSGAAGAFLLLILVFALLPFRKITKKNAGTVIYKKYNRLDKNSISVSMLFGLRNKYIKIGDLYSKNNDYKAALPYYYKAYDDIKTIRDIIESNDEITLYYKISLCYMMTGDFNNAEHICSNALIFREYANRRNKEPAETDILNHKKLSRLMGDICFETGKYADALEYYNTALKISETINDDEHKEKLRQDNEVFDIKDDTIWFGENHPDIALEYDNLGRTYSALGNREKAMECFLTAAAKYKKAGMMYVIRNEYSEALDWFLKALAEYQKASGEENREAADICYQIGGIYGAKHNYEQVAEWYGMAAKMCGAILGSDHPDTMKILESVNNLQTNQTRNRQIRVFISSTFRDMQDERDYLVMKVFPSIRRYCEERDISFFELDLRWGISEEESKQGKVVDICLKEIQNTTPFFIGMLGERYGWVPSEAERKTIAENTSVFEDYPWVQKELDGGTSITEIEIQDGVLRANDKVNAYFYFRSPEMPASEEFREISGSYEEQKLTALKKTLREQQDYPVKDYFSIENLGDMVEKDFKALVDQLFPQGALSPFEKERLDQTAFLKSRTKVYNPNEYVLSKLDLFVNAPGENADRIMVVTGTRGMGKSALLANWIQRREEKGDAIAYHFIGNSGSEGDYRKISEYLINEVARIAGVSPDGLSSAGETPGADNGADTDTPQGEDEHTKRLQNLLWEAAKTEKMTIVLDGLDKLEDIDNAKLLNWLPAFPPNVRVVFSTQPDDETMDVCKRRNYPCIEVEALPPEDRKTFIKDYLGTFGKKLREAQIERIVQDRETENALALRTLLDELRVFGVHEEIDAHIDDYLAAPDLESFFDKVLDRIEKTYGDAGGNTKNFARDVLALLAFSRAGLSESEILGITGAAPLYWSQLYNGMAGHLGRRKGLIVFDNWFVQNSVLKRRLDEGEAYRRRIVSYMETAADIAPGRKYDELPHQYFELQEWDKLYAFLMDFDVFEYINKKDEYELGRYWRALREKDSEKYSLGKYLELESGERGGEELARIYTDIGATLYKALGDYPQSLEYSLKTLAIREKAPGTKKSDIAESYNNIGFLYEHIGDYPQALEYCHKALAIREEALGTNHSDTAQSYNNIGALYNRMGNYPQALEYCRKALAIREEALGTKHPDTAQSYNNIGVIYKKMGNYPQALEYCYKTLAIQEEVRGTKHPDIATPYNNIGTIYSKMGNYPQALEYCRKALAIQEEVRGIKHPYTITSYNNIGSIYGNMKDYPQALEYCHRALAIREEVLGTKHPNTATSYNYIGMLYSNMKDYPQALEYYRKALAIREEVRGTNHSDTAQSYNNIGMLYSNMKDYPQALEYCRKALAIREEIRGMNHSDTALSYNNIGSIYFKMNDYPQALEYCRRALAIREEVLGKNHPDTALSYRNTGDTYNKLSDHPQALNHYQQALEIYRALGDEKSANTVRKSIDRLTSTQEGEKQ
jgi:tetratricopeptide (TPR) repeat protein